MDRYVGGMPPDLCWPKVGAQLKAPRTSWGQLEPTDRRWISGAAAATGLLLIASIAALLWQRASQASAQRELLVAVRIHEEGQQRSARLALERSSFRPPWWAGLPLASAEAAEPQLPDLLSNEALKLAKVTGVRLLRLSSLPQPSVPSALYRRMALKVELKGRYSAVKHWVAEMLGRHSGALAIRSMEIRRPDAPAGESSASEVEASIELYLFESISPSTVVTTPAASP